MGFDSGSIYIIAIFYSDLLVTVSGARTGSNEPAELLPNSLEKGLEWFRAPNSIAREILNSDMVDYIVRSKEHELHV
ncbi:hypothetical protein EJ08DRAFT_98661 [Tothia fuscella]|uniref:Uncharacterized protein n=1 Tax=Tothia fuscella TaxID=1048955 RepID=A0A9P4NEB1_9PEZI|nr:hypothetical protein EJ08DRAFT_98661 [Tothia fuscella]